MSENTKLLSSELREQRLARITNAVEPDLELILEKVTPQTFELHPMLCERAGVPVGHQVTYEDFKSLMVSGRLPGVRKIKKPVVRGSLKYIAPSANALAGF